MSGNQFLKCLQRLDFPKANHKDGKSFDWMFEDSVLSPFLTWYCDNLQEGNLISDQDLNEYKNYSFSADYPAHALNLLILLLPYYCMYTYVIFLFVWFTIDLKD